VRIVVNGRSEVHLGAKAKSDRQDRGLMDLIPRRKEHNDTESWWK
jgi:hypothetical protein